MALSVSANKFNKVEKDLNNLNIKTSCTSMDYLKKKVQSLVKKTLKEQKKNKKISGGYSPFIYKQAGGCNCNRPPKSEMSGGCGCNYGKYMSGGMLGATVLPQRYFNPKMEGGSHGNGDYHITSYVDNTSIARAGIPSNFSGGEGFRGWIKNANRRRTSQNIQNLLADRNNVIKKREKERIQKILSEFDNLLIKTSTEPPHLANNSNQNNFMGLIYETLKEKDQLIYIQLIEIIKKYYFIKKSENEDLKFYNFSLYIINKYLLRLKEGNLSLKPQAKKLAKEICIAVLSDIRYNFQLFMKLLLKVNFKELVNAIYQEKNNNVNQELKNLQKQLQQEGKKSNSQSGGKSHNLRIKKYNVLTSSKMTEADIKVANKMSNTILSYVVNYLKVHKKLLHKEKPLLLTQKIVKHIFDDMNKDRNFKL